MVYFGADDQEAEAHFIYSLQRTISWYFNKQLGCNFNVTGGNGIHLQVPGDQDPLDTWGQ